MVKAHFIAPMVRSAEPRRIPSRVSQGVSLPLGCQYLEFRRRQSPQISIRTLPSIVSRYLPVIRGDTPRVSGDQVSSPLFDQVPRVKKFQHLTEPAPHCIAAVLMALVLFLCPWPGSEASAEDSKKTPKASSKSLAAKNSSLQAKSSPVHSILPAKPLDLAIQRERLSSLEISLIRIKRG